MSEELALWLGLGAFVVAALLVDLRFFARRRERVSFRRAAVWSVGWTLAGFAFVVPLLLVRGRAPAEEYLAGFLVEKSLSADNLFVFALILTYFGVPSDQHRRAIFWGIVGAIVLRGVFIVGGASLLDAFHWTVYVFGGFLILTGIRMARQTEHDIEPERTIVYRVLSRLLPMTPRYADDRLFVREAGRRVGTPLLAALVLIAAFDVIFAVDSIPAIFAITRDVYVVAAANAFSLLGLQALYFTLAGAADRFEHLSIGLGVILVFVGAKMAFVDFVKIPVWLSLAVIALILAVTIATSLVASSRRLRTRRSAGRTTSTRTPPSGGDG